MSTAVLIPNTIATMLGNAVWVYGPQDIWLYLLLIVGATAAGTALMWVYIKRKGMFPEFKEFRICPPPEAAKKDKASQ